MSQIWRFARYLIPYWDKELALLTSRFFSTLLGLATPFLARLTIDYAYNTRDLRVYNALVIAGGLIWLVNGVLGLLTQYVEAYVQQMVDLDLRRVYYKHLQRLSLRFFQSRSTGEQMYRASSDIQGVSSFIVSTVPNVLVTFVRLIGLLVISFYLHWRLTLLILVISPAFYLHAHYFGNRQKALYERLVQKSQDISAALQEAISHTKLIKAFGKERREARRYISQWVERLRLGFQQTRLAAYGATSRSLLNTVVVTGLSYYLGYQLITGQVSLGTLTALTLYLFQLLGSLKSIGSTYSSILVRFVSLDRLLQTLDAESEIAEAPNAVSVRTVAEPIVFEQVTFGYEAPTAVLERVSFNLEPGQTIALVGPSGVGKTSIINLLLRFYDPWEGQVLINGHDLRQLKLADWRQQVSVAMQDAMLLNRSIAENIRFGYGSATETQVIEAAKMADAHGFINELPASYDTVIGEEGCNLSAGQQQRIAIARALVKPAALLILDEGMSSISSASEARILRALRETQRYRFVIIASHRLSTVRHADQILLLKGSGIAERGTHQELVAARGEYYHLFSEQLFSEQLGEAHD